MSQMMPDGPELLRNATPSAAVQKRIVAGALERSATGQRRLVPMLAVWATVALAFAAVFLLLRPAKTEGLTTGAVAETLDVPLTVSAAGHQVRLELDSAVRAERVETATTLLELSRGQAAFQVRHLQTGERFAVTAGEVTVEAVGTQFSVALQGACVRVEMSEGRVEIRRPQRAPEQLAAPSGGLYCNRPAGPETLTDEERLIFGALDGVRRGTAAELDRSAAQLEEYLRRFPGGGYEEEALYYLARIAEKRGRPDDSRRWAEQLLARFPSSRRAADLSRPRGKLEK